MKKKFVRQVCADNDIPANAAEVIVDVRNYVLEKEWRGASYPISAILYICLKEQGLDPKLCLGKCLSGNKYFFDYGWVELNGKVIDLTADMLLEKRPPLAPVVMGIDSETGKPTDTFYGIYGNFGGADGKGSLTKMAFEESDIFPDIMNIKNYRKVIDEPDGLWSVVMKILGRKGSSKHLKEKYGKLPWIYIEKYKLSVRTTLVVSTAG